MIDAEEEFNYLTPNPSPWGEGSLRRWQIKQGGPIRRQQKAEGLKL